MAKGNAALQLRNKCADLLAVIAKTRGCSEAEVHPFSVLMEIALDKENTSTSLRLEAARRACAFVAPTLGNMDFTSAGEKLEPGVRVSHLTLVQQLVHSSADARADMLKLLTSAEPVQEDSAE